MKRLVYLLSAIIFLVTACEGNTTAPADPTVTPFPTAEIAARPTYVVQRGTVQQSLEFSGRWQPRDQMQLAFEVGGNVRQVNVRQGDSIAAGEVLADLQIDDLEEQLVDAELALQSAINNAESGEDTGLQQVQDAEIALANAQLALQNTRASAPWTGTASAWNGIETAERNLEEARRQYREALSRPDQPASAVDSAYQAVLNAEDQVESAWLSYYSSAQSFNNHQFSIQQQENSVLSAELALERARAAQEAGTSQEVYQEQLQIDRIKEDIANSTLISPIDGVVMEVTLQPGDSVEAFRAVMTIGIPEPKEVIASLPLSDVQQLSTGMIGVCQAANRPETAVQCLVRRLPAGSQDADQTTRLAASLEGLPENQLIEVIMPLETREDVLWLPPFAIRTFQGRVFVVVETPQGPRSVDVELGLETDDRVEIVSGVSEGDVIVAP